MNAKDKKNIQKMVNNFYKKEKEIAIAIKENVIDTYMDKKKYIEAMGIALKTNFDTNKIIKKKKKCDIENFKKEYNK